MFGLSLWHWSILLMIGGLIAVIVAITRRRPPRG